MCVYSYTDYEVCGCYRIHATLPCLNAFDRSLPQCDPRDYVQGETVNEECPECKPAFDNKDPREPHTSSLRPQGRILQVVYPRLKLTFKSRLISKVESPSPEMDENGKKKHLEELAQIDQQQNQFRGLNPQEKLVHNTTVLLNWLNNPEHPAPAPEKHFATSPGKFSPQGTGIPVIPTATWSPSEHNAYPVISGRRSRKQRQPIGERPHRRDYGFKITPPLPLPTPPTTMKKTLSVSIRNEYILTVRKSTLSTSQRKAMARAGYPTVRSLSVITRDQVPQDITPNDDATRLRGNTFSATQRAALRRAGHHNMRKISITSRRPQDLLC